ncbi:MAG: hypothetical protein J6Q48_05890 [Bacteroidaceae bacterium]|nr:hypothetical protein [Bacteroidaceae bacterium]
MSNIYGKGIDVSSHNGEIKWSAVAKEIDFAIIRAGFGSGNIDQYAVHNIKECERLSIPYGLYWFSYAYSIDMARKESEYLCNFADKYNPTLPLFFDYEYDSDKYAKLHCPLGVTDQMRYEFAMAFLNNVEKRGYFAALYSNIDYLNKGFRAITKRFALWLAEWGVSSPSVPCIFWQSTDSGKVNGISGKVDMNTAYKLFAGLHEETEKITPTQLKEIQEISEGIIEKYVAVAQAIIKGEYGNGEERKNKLKNAGYDYELAQGIVNYLLGIK